MVGLSSLAGEESDPFRTGSGRFKTSVAASGIVAYQDSFIVGRLLNTVPPKNDFVRCRKPRETVLSRRTRRTTIASDTRDEILTATRQLLALMIRRNGIEPADVASAIFTVTKDVTANFPALAARQLG